MILKEPTNNKDLKSIYARRFAGIEASRNEVWKVLTRDYFQKWVSPQDVVLDVGAGFCEFINNIQAKQKIAMDLNPMTLKKAAREVMVLPQDMTQDWPIPSNSVDVVFSSNFFEHLPDQRSLMHCLKEINRVLRPNGLLMAMGPNIRFCFKEYWDFLDHYLALSDRSITEAVEISGFETEAVIPQFLPYTMRGKLSPHPLLVRLYLSLPIFWRVMGKQFLIFARKSPVPAASTVVIPALETLEKNRSMKLGNFKIVQFNLTTIFSFLLCLIVLAVFVPLNPIVPGLGLDASWMMAMNQGVVQGLVFGRDIVFTFGPYSSVYTEVYNPATDKLMILGSLYLGLNYAILLLLLAKGEHKFKLLLYGIFLACLLDSRDALLFTYPIILALVTYRLILPDEHSSKLRLGNPSTHALALLFAPMGLLVLIKGSLLPLCGIIEFFCVAILSTRKQLRALALLSVVVPAICCAVFWNFSGQPVFALPQYFISSRQFISGYTEAMAVPGEAWECVLYVLASLLIFAVIFINTGGTKASRLFLGGSFAIFLFTAFKAGFVRHDAWHNVTAGSSLLAAGLLLLFVMDARPSLLPLAMAALVWVYIGHGAAVHSTTDDVSANLRATFARNYRGLKARAGKNDDLRRYYDQNIAYIKATFPIPQLPGTTDIYSYNQAWLLASENTWAPRPVTQSYTVFTPELAELNLRHLEGPNAPDNILFSVEPIDGRLPSIEDGLSWPTLINNYSYQKTFQKLGKDSAYLRKRSSGIENVSTSGADLSSSERKFGEDVALPDASEPLFARVQITPTLAGKIWGALFEPPQLHIAVHTRDGKLTNYRVVSGMLKTDFLITPLVRSTEEFLLLAAAGGQYLTRNQVTSISIFEDGRPGLLWNTTYTLKLRKINLLRNTDAENSKLFDKIDEPLSSRPASAPTPACEGSIESVNGAAPRSGIPIIGNAISVKGWLAVSGKDGIVPDRTFVTLTGKNGKITYIQAHSIARDDIRGHFNQLAMPDPGYAALADVSSLNGNYVLGLARTYKETTNICEQFRWPVQISH